MFLVNHANHIYNYVLFKQKPFSSKIKTDPKLKQFFLLHLGILERQKIFLELESCLNKNVSLLNSKLVH